MAASNPVEAAEGFAYHPGTKAGVLFGTVFVRGNAHVLVPGRRVYFSGTFLYRDTWGLPLVFIFDKLEQLAGRLRVPVSPCLSQFVSDARSAGWSERRIHSDLGEGLAEWFGPTVAIPMLGDLGSVLIHPRDQQGFGFVSEVSDGE